MTKTKYELGAIPFLVGTYESPNNPHSLPNVLPFSYFTDPKTNVLKQSYCPEIEQHLQTAYENESMMGTPMDIEGEGRHYLFDFLEFIENQTPSLSRKNILEIGCGRGFLIKSLQDKGVQVTGIEPSKNLENYWHKNQVNVINGFFPSLKITQKFDSIIAYGVLEHINNAEDFVKSIANQLNDNGQIILAVPNCEDQIKNCDPSLFVHEHYSYFSKESLAHFLEILGFKINAVEYAGYGGSIYICAEKSQTEAKSHYNEAHFNIDHFSSEVNKFNALIKEQIETVNKQGKTLGIYCPGRALSSIPSDIQCRFFDDDDQIHGLYYPPFNFPIENKDELIAKPVDVLWIFSYSFGDRIKDKLKNSKQLANTKILTLNELNNKK